MSFANKTVLITGASSGIGAVTAKMLTAEGATIAMVGRNSEKLKKSAAECEKVGAKPLVIQADITNDDHVKDVIKQTIDKFGKLNVLVNNAGMSSYGSILDGKVLSVFDITMNTNLRSAVHLTMLATPYLAKTKGNIVNVSSVAATTLPPKPQSLAYCISKAGLDHFSRCCAKELAPIGIRVNIVSPGPVSTDILENSGAPTKWDQLKAVTAFNRVGEPEEIADLIMYVASDRAKGVTGAVFLSDSGFSLKY